MIKKKQPTDVCCFPNPEHKKAAQRGLEAHQSTSVKAGRDIPLLPGNPVFQSQPEYFHRSLEDKET
ncbi:MAG: hypothetical protein GX228_09870 [Firmicutes bacterium]|jgi:hypothetical protein|nr:hypothetical protein [Bacillota bacterium]NLL89200.1 hypothetical protein [Bacillota bacterium]